MSSFGKLMREIRQLQTSESDYDNTLDILARPSLKKITGSARTNYSDPSTDPILIQAELAQSKRFREKTSEKKNKTNPKGVVTKPRFVRLRSKPDTDMPSGKTGRSSMSLMNDEIISPTMEKEFTFTDYDIMEDDQYQGKLGTTPEEEQRDLYREACKRIGTTPVSYIERTLTTKQVCMRNHGLGSKGTRALAVALTRNDTVEILDLTDNSISHQGAMCVAQMVSHNKFITELNLSENALGHEGLKAIISVMKTKRNIRKLDLSATSLQDSDVEHIKVLLEQNIHLQDLRLAHNQIGEDGGLLLGKAFKHNDTLEILDLSWNHLRGKGAAAIAQGLEGNLGIKELDLSWNGFAMAGCEALSKALTKNKFLTSLNLASNRIHNEALIVLLRGLKKNCYLVNLKIASNPLTPDVTPAILQAVNQMKSDSIKMVDMEDIVVTEEFLDMLATMKESRDITILYGPCVTKPKALPTSRDRNQSLEDPRELLLQILQKEGLRVIDLFKKFDKEKTWTISADDFRKGLLDIDINLSQHKIEKLILLYDKNGSGEIDLRDLSNYVTMNFKEETDFTNGRNSESRNTTVNLKQNFSSLPESPPTDTDMINVYKRSTLTTPPGSLQEGSPRQPPRTGSTEHG